MVLNIVVKVCHSKSIKVISVYSKQFVSRITKLNAFLKAMFETSLYNKRVATARKGVGILILLCT